MNPTVIIIDDDEQVCGLLSEVFESDGWLVYQASDGLAAKQLCLFGEVDLVITDLIMPNIEGLQIIMELRREHPALPIIAMSGGGRGAAGKYLTIAGKLGATTVVAKPISPLKILEIARLLTSTG